ENERNEKSKKKSKTRNEKEKKQSLLKTRDLRLEREGVSDDHLSSSPPPPPPRFWRGQQYMPYATLRRSGHHLAILFLQFRNSCAVNSYVCTCRLTKRNPVHTRTRALQNTYPPVWKSTRP